MQFIQNHVSARYPSFHVTLVISVSRSLVHRRVLFHCPWNTHTHALCKCWKITRRSFKRLWVCFLLKKKRVWLQRQPKNFFWCTETRGVIFIMYISDRKSSRTITLNLFLHLIRRCFCFLLLLLCIRHFGLSRNSLAKKLHAVSTKHAWESSGLLQVECGFVPEVLTIKL